MGYLTLDGLGDVLRDEMGNAIYDPEGNVVDTVNIRYVGPPRVIDYTTIKEEDLFYKYAPWSNTTVANTTIVPTVKTFYRPSRDGELENRLAHIKSSKPLW